VHASVGTRLVVHGRTLGVPDRHCVVIATGGREGTPPFTVRWDDGHEGMFFPGPDTGLEPKTSGARRSRRMASRS
jgi:hypothetical protein